MPELMLFNAFGLIKVNRDSVVVNITAVAAGGKAINRSLVEDAVEPILLIDEDEFGSAMFAAYIEPGKKTRITFHELNDLKSGSSVSVIPVVGAVLLKALDLVRERAGIPT
jgi:hypothetical protein